MDPGTDDLVPHGLVGSLTGAETRGAIEQLLVIARERSGMEIAWLSEIVGEKLVFRVVTAGATNWRLKDDDVLLGADSYCQRMLEGRIPPVVWDSFEEPMLHDLQVTHTLGIRGYIGVPVSLSDGTPYGALCAASHEPNPGTSEHDRRLLDVLGHFIARDLQNRAETNWRSRRQAQSSAATALVRALEARDGYTGEHAEAVRDLANAVAAELDCEPSVRETIERIALLHDIGKMGVRDEVLRHDGPLDEDGWREIRRHPGIAETIVAEIPELMDLGQALRAEHERWDGQGYPDGLAGEDIPVASRIILVCDAYHAMTSDRPYRRAMPKDRAIAELQTHSGTQFWPAAVDALLRTLGAEG